VDTICTLCSKGCNTTAWIKAKPEWAKGARLVRFTPRFNPDVNGYWMCDIGRFRYQWIEGEERLSRPLARDAHGVQQPVAWHDALRTLADRLSRAASERADGLRFLASAHASLEELFLLGRLAGVPGAPRALDQALTLSWSVSVKDQPPGTTFKVPEVDAPNVSGARMLGLAGSGGSAAAPPRPDVSALRTAVLEGRVAALYVLDPGPDGSIGDVQWIVDARAAGRLPLLVVHGVLMTDLARAADLVLPGASFVEKEASYVNDQGRLQGAARAIAPPGEAMEDWRILLTVGEALGAPLGYSTPAEIRSDLVARFPGEPGLQDLGALTFARPIAARHWLQTSNPSERWKWDFMFQDLPPVKGEVDTSALPMPPGSIPLREVR
jgi:NADH-quinone oxidoreductase subunit G